MKKEQLVAMQQKHFGDVRKFWQPIHFVCSPQLVKLLSSPRPFFLLIPGDHQVTAQTATPASRFSPLVGSTPALFWAPLTLKTSNLVQPTITTASEFPPFLQRRQKCRDSICVPGLVHYKRPSCKTYYCGTWIVS